MFFELEDEKQSHLSRRRDSFNYIYTIHNQSSLSKLWQVEVVYYIITLLELGLLELENMKTISCYFSNDTIALALGALALVIALQAVLGLLYGWVTPYMKGQIQVYRYVIYLPLLHSSLQLTQTYLLKKIYGLYAAYLILSILAILFVVAIDLYFLVQNFSESKTEAPLCLLLTIYQTIATIFTVVDMLPRGKSIIRFILILGLNKSIEKSYDCERPLVRFYRTAVRLLAILSFIEVYNSLSEVPMIAVATSLVLALISIVACEELYFEELRTEFGYKNVQSMGIPQFLRYVRRMLVCLQRSRQTLKAKNVVSAELVGFLVQHQQECTQVDCPLRNTFYSTNSNNNRSANQGTSMFYSSTTAGTNVNNAAASTGLGKLLNPAMFEIFFDRIYAKMDDMIAIMRSKHPEDIDLLICSLNLNKSMKHKPACYELLKSARQIALSFRLQYFIFSFEKGLESLDNIEEQSIQGLKFDEVVSKFKGDVLAGVKRILQFWQEFEEEVIDLDNIITISKRVNRSRVEIQAVWERISRLETFTTLQILALYTAYCKFLNEYELGFELDQKQYRMIAALSNSKEFRFIQGEDYSNRQQGVCLISVNQISLGTIDYCNKYFASLFGYSPKELSKQKLNIIIPELFASQHDNYLKSAVDGNAQHTALQFRKHLFGRHKNGYIFPVSIQLKKSAGKLDFKFMAITTPRPHPLNHIYILTDNNFQVTDISPGYQKMSPESAKRREISQLITPLAEYHLSEIADGRQQPIGQISLEIRTKFYPCEVTLLPITVRGITLGYMFTFEPTKSVCVIGPRRTTARGKNSKTNSGSSQTPPIYFQWTYQKRGSMPSTIYKDGASSPTPAIAEDDKNSQKSEQDVFQGNLLKSFRGCLKSSDLDNFVGTMYSAQNPNRQYSFVGEVLEEANFGANGLEARNTSLTAYNYGSKAGSNDSVPEENVQPQKDFGEGIHPIRFFDDHYQRLDDWGMSEDQDDYSQRFEQVYASQNFSDRMMGALWQFFGKHLKWLKILLVLCFIFLMLMHMLTGLSLLADNQYILSRNMANHTIEVFTSQFASTKIISKFENISLSFGEANDPEPVVIKKIQANIQGSGISGVYAIQLQKLLFLQEEYNFPTLFDPVNALKMEFRPFKGESFQYLLMLMVGTLVLGILYYISLRSYDGQLVAVLDVFLNLEQASLKLLLFSTDNYIKELEQSGDKQQMLDVMDFEDQNSIRKRRIRRIKNKERYTAEDILKVTCVVFILCLYVGCFILVFQAKANSMRTLERVLMLSMQSLNFGANQIISTLAERYFDIPYLDRDKLSIQDFQYQIESNSQQFGLEPIRKLINNGVCDLFPASMECQKDHYGILKYGVNKAMARFLYQMYEAKFPTVNELISSIMLFDKFLVPIYFNMTEILRGKTQAYLNNMSSLLMVLTVPLLVLMMFVWAAISLELEKKKGEVSTLITMVNLIPGRVMKSEVPYLKIKGYQAIRDGQ